MTVNSQLIFGMILGGRANCDIMTLHTDTSTTKILTYHWLYTSLPWALDIFSHVPIHVNSFQGCTLIFLRLSRVKIWNSICLLAWLSVSCVALTWGVVTSSEAWMLKAIPSNMWSTRNTAKASLATVRFAVLPTNSIL